MNVAKGTIPDGVTRVMLVGYDPARENRAEGTIVNLGAQAEAHDPKTAPLTVQQGAPIPPAADAIANKDALPAGTKYAWKDGKAPDTAAAGEKDAVVTVTYPDGSAEDVPVKVTVKATPTDADKSEPAPKIEEKPEIKQERETQESKGEVKVETKTKPQAPATTKAKAKAKVKAKALLPKTGDAGLAAMVAAAATGTAAVFTGIFRARKRS